MGNILQQDDRPIIPPSSCSKCKDRFIPTYGGYSHRTSCRFHRYENGICIDCDQIPGETYKHHNCYHINNKPCFYRICKWKK